MNNRFPIYCAITAIVCFLAGWWVNGMRKNSEIEQLKAEHASAIAERDRREADARQALSDAIESAALQYQKQSDEMASKIEKLKQEYANAKKKNPLPAGCSPDAERMRIIREAVSGVNSARSSVRQ